MKIFAASLAQNPKQKLAGEGSRQRRTSIAIGRGDMRCLPGASARDLSYSVATGIALTIAVTSLFEALSLGPASIVVPIYGMFVVGGAVLGMLVLHEPINVYKLIGIGLATASIYFITANPVQH
jgi:bacterial/archaeal transporter family protein